MAQFYLGSTPLNQTWLGSTQINDLNFPGFTGFLDLNPGALAAYSLRRLSGNYNGPIINIRRASDNATADIGFDSSNYLDIDAITAFVPTPQNVFVTTWYDQSGNGYDLENSTTATQPLIATVAGYYFVNGLRSIRPNSTFSQSLSASFGTTIEQPLTWFDVGQILSTPGVLHSNTNTSSDLEFRTAVGPDWIMSDLVNEVKLDNQDWDSTSTNDQVILSQLYNSGSSFFKVDGMNLGSYKNLTATGTLNANNIEGIRLNGRPENTNYGTFSIQESIVYASNLSGSVSNIINDLNGYYNTFTP
jgi:hypothetical protein